MVVRESTAVTREARRNVYSMPHGRTGGPRIIYILSPEYFQEIVLGQRDT